MPWPQIVKTGTVTINPSGKVYVKGFEFEHAGCREGCQLGMAWAIEKLGAALVEDMSADYPKLSAID